MPSALCEVFPEIKFSLWLAQAFPLPAWDLWENSNIALVVWWQREAPTCLLANISLSPGYYKE